MQLRFTFLTIVGLLLVAGCDFQAAEDAFNDFSVIIELEPVNTVVTAVVYDIRNGNLIDAELSFSGNLAGSLIDVYSDPITTLSADGGLVSFGLNNAIVPAESAPARLTVRARADGFFPGARNLVLVEPGSGQISIPMTPSDADAVIPGTSRTQGSATTDASGAATQTTMVTTQPTSQTGSVASVTIPQGTVATTVSGAPASGSINVAVRTYDRSQGHRTLPGAAVESGDGATGILAGAAAISFQDSNGSTVAGFSGSSTTVRIESTDPALRALYERQAATGQTVPVGIHLFSPLDGTLVRIGDSVLDVDAAGKGGILPTSFTLYISPRDYFLNGVRVDEDTYFCFMGYTAYCPELTSETIDDILLIGTIESTTIIPANADHLVTIDGFSGDKSIDFNLSGLFYESATKTVTGGASYTVETLLNLSQVPSDGGEYTLTGTYTGSSDAASVTISDLVTGSSTLTMVAPLTTYTADATISCPANQKFSVEVTESSLDGVTLSYRQEGSTDAYATVSSSNITSRSVTDGSITVVGIIDLLPGTTYDFIGVFGSNQASTTQTTPSSGDTFTVSLDANDVGIDCEAI